MFRFSKPKMKITMIFQLFYYLMYRLIFNIIRAVITFHIFRIPKKYTDSKIVDRKRYVLLII